MSEPAAASDTEDVIRVYRREWVIVHSLSGPNLEELLTQTRDHFQNNYAGRVHDADADIRAATAGPDSFVVLLRLFKPNLKGEFKTRDAALAFADGQGWCDAEFVARNSKRDHDIRAYGVKKLA